MSKGKVTDQKKGHHIAWAFIIPGVIAIVDLWVCAYFIFHNKGTWMEVPTWITGVIVIFIDLGVFTYLVEHARPLDDV